GTMSINSQFLYSYIDELIKSQWIDWSENLLSRIPSKEFQTRRGFQELTGADNSFIRSRALEGFRLGLFNGRVISERGGSHSELPEGWKRVCSGIPIHTRLGYFAYVIGKALEKKPDDSILNSAVDAIAAIQIMLIAFKYQDRWYSTVNIFDYVRSQYEKALKRTLDNKEIRFLSGAVFNTLDRTDPTALIESYKNNTLLPPLYLIIQNDGGKVEVTPENLEQIISGNFNINSIEKLKAALFWSSEERGIYSRASASGRKFLTIFMEIDRALAAAGNASILHGVLESINEKDAAKDLIDTLSLAAHHYPKLLEQWEKIMVRLESGVVASLEYFSAREENKHPFLAIALKGIRETLEEDYEAEDNAEDIEAPEGVSASVTANNKAAKSPKKPTTPKAINKEKILSSAAQQDMLFVAPPPGKEVQQQTTNKKKTIRKFDAAARDAKNRELGLIGEEFIVEVERQKLIALGYVDLAAEVKWVSKHLGDGAGYDISSYDIDKAQIFIEVKATRGGITTQFYISENELMVSKEKGLSFRLYRVFDLDKEPRIYVLKGALDSALDLQPTSYRARVK
ncbi:MAG: DUF3883 domain-containing protein, partial [Rickettsiales bacterium]|nr:DUF3883 domain-containing protein [Rickettsiales bacterium]